MLRRHDEQDGEAAADRAIGAHARGESRERRLGRAHGRRVAAEEKRDVVRATPGEPHRGKRDGDHDIRRRRAVRVAEHEHGFGAGNP